MIIMNRTEFCKLLHDKFYGARVGLKNSLPFAFELGVKRINSIILGSHNFKMRECTTFLSMCSNYLVINDIYLEHTCEIAKLMAEERKKAGMTIKDLSLASGVHPNIISAFERQCSSLKVDSFLAIADALMCDITIE